MLKTISRLETLQICKLLQCVRLKDKKQIEKLSDKGAPHLINYIDPNEGNTALTIAAGANDPDMVEFLLNIGAHPDVMDLKGRTAAMHAAELGNNECLEKLIAAGANMTLVDLEGKGILFYCITSSQRHAKCVELALAAGAEVNNIARNGCPLVTLACETAAENEELCLKFLENGADPNAKQEKSGNTALMAAAGSGSVKIVKAILEKGATVNALDMRKNHAAHFAASKGHLEVLQILSGYGANFDQTNQDGNTPIHLAAKGGHAMCCKFLSQRGCNPKSKNNEGSTARTIAKDEGHKEALKEVRKAERTFGKVGKNNEPWTLAFYDWMMTRKEKLLQMMTQFDPDGKGIVSKDDFIDTITGLQGPVEEEEMKRLATLHEKNRDGNIDYNEFIAAKKWVNKNFLRSAFEGKRKKKKGKKGGRKGGKFKLVMPICTQDEGPRMDGGAPPEIFIPRHTHFTDTGRFDRDHPPAHPLQDDSAWYLHHPEKTYINLNEAVKDGDFDSLKTALQRGIHVDTRDKFFKTPLMTACAVGQFEMVKYLVDNGAQINARDNFKWTPLHHACHAGQLDIVQYLIQHGGEINATTMNGGTPLTRAIESSREAIVKYLIDLGVKMQTENRKGMSPLDIAQAWADWRVLEIVQRKWDTLPPPDDKKKGKGGKGGAAKRPISAPSDWGEPAHQPHKPRETIAIGDPGLHRKGSILRAASALAGGMAEQEDITYTPLKVWTKQPDTEELIHEKVVKRERFGWEVDFSDFEMPFKKNISNKLQALGPED